MCPVCSVTYYIVIVSQFSMLLRRYKEVCSKHSLLHFVLTVDHDVPSQECRENKPSLAISHMHGNTQAIGAIIVGF